jgi:hypothetical protein
MTDRAKIAMIVLSILLLAGVFMVDWRSCCSTGTDEDAIRALIDRATDLIERHQVGDLMELTTEGFTAQPRNKNRRETKRYLFLALQRYGNFTLLSPRAGVEIEPDGSTASATVYYLMVKGKKALPDLDGLVDQPDEWLREVGDVANLFRIQLYLVKVDGDWLIASAHYQRFKGTGFD